MHDCHVLIARSNILNDTIGSEFTAGLLKARLHEELKSSAARKTARADVESDLLLLHQLLVSQPKGLASTTEFAIQSQTLSAEGFRSSPATAGCCHK
jgi:hypothetical protein